MIFNRTAFYAEADIQFDRLKSGQRAALGVLLGFIAADKVFSGVPTLVAIRRLAYMLATVKHETAHTFEPIDERGGASYFETRYGHRTDVGRRLGNTRPGDGARFHGRGYVQLTGRNNYERATDYLRSKYPEEVAAFESSTGQRFDLIKFPEQAKDARIAYLVMSAGMHQGWFTTRRLSHYIHERLTDYTTARRIINGMDSAGRIAGIADRFEVILRRAFIKPEPVASPAALDSAGVTFRIPAERPDLQLVPSAQATAEAPEPSFLDEIPANETTKSAGRVVARRAGFSAGRLVAYLGALLNAGDPRAWFFIVVAVVGLGLLVYFERKRLAGFFRSAFRLVGRFS